VDAAGETLRLTDSKFQIDDTLGEGQASFKGGTRKAASFDIKTGMIDIDAFLPRGVGVAAEQEKASWADIAGLIAPLVPDSLKLRLLADGVRLNTVEATNVTIDTESNLAGIAINVFRAGSLGNAMFDALGQIKFANDGPAGNLAATVIADDPRGLLRLAGLLPEAGDSLWLDATGKTDLRATIDIARKADAPSITLDVMGTSGKLRVNSNVILERSFDPVSGLLSGTAEIASTDSEIWIDIAGLEHREASSPASNLSATFSGSLGEKVATDLQLDAIGARFTQNGTVTIRHGGIESTGSLGIESENAPQFLTALGLTGNSERVIQLQSPYTLQEAGLSLPEIKGRFQGNEVGGQVGVSTGRAITGQLTSKTAHLATILSTVFLPWDGRPLDAETPFARDWPFGLSGEIWLKPERLTVVDGLDVTESEVGIVSDATGKRIAMFGTDAEGSNVSIEAGVKPKGALYALDGRVNLPLDLSLMKTEPDGQPVAQGTLQIEAKFSGEGRSPTAALAALKGSGSYEIDRLKVGRLNVPEFLKAIAAAKSGSDVRNGLNLLTGSGEVDLGTVKGPVTIVDGVAAFTPVRVNSETNDIVLKPRFEAATATLDIDVQVSLKSEDNLPGLNISYNGVPGAMIRSVDTAQLESQVSMKVLQNAMLELEAVQREQQRILEEEARQAKIDAERVAAWEAHRRELQRRTREIKVFQRVREQEAEDYAQWLSELGKLAKSEMAMRARELKQQRKVRQQLERNERDAALEPASVQPDEIMVPTPVKPPAAKPKAQVRAKPKATPPKAEEPFVPLVLVPPANPPPPAQEKKPRTLLDLLNP
jgi:hypothetical protein